MTSLWVSSSASDERNVTTGFIKTESLPAEGSARSTSGWVSHWVQP